MVCGNRLPMGDLLGSADCFHWHPSHKSHHFCRPARNKTQYSHRQETTPDSGHALDALSAGVDLSHQRS